MHATVVFQVRMPRNEAHASNFIFFSRYSCKGGTTVSEHYKSFVTLAVVRPKIKVSQEPGAFCIFLPSEPIMSADSLDQHVDVVPPGGAYSQERVQDRLPLPPALHDPESAQTQDGIDDCLQEGCRKGSTMSPDDMLNTARDLFTASYGVEAEEPSKAMTFAHLQDALADMKSGIKQCGPEDQVFETPPKAHALQ